MTVTWMDAKAADGPKVVEWLEARVELKDLNSDRRRRLADWRRPGALAKFDAVDRTLTYFGRHISELPDDVWLDKGFKLREPAAEGPVVTVKPRKVETRFCIVCDREIARIQPNGRPISPGTYAERKYCHRECQWKGLSASQAETTFVRKAA